MLNWLSTQRLLVAVAPLANWWLWNFEAHTECIGQWFYNNAGIGGAWAAATWRRWHQNRGTAGHFCIVNVVRAHCHLQWTWNVLADAFFFNEHAKRNQKYFNFIFTNTSGRPGGWANPRKIDWRISVRSGDRQWRAWFRTPLCTWPNGCGTWARQSGTDLS